MKTERCGTSRIVLSHNNKVNGIFVWQNNPGKSVIDRFVAYHNGKAGIEHGAYKNVLSVQELDALR